MSALITVTFVVPVGHDPGDYARLHGNGGAGDIDWDTPVSDEVFDLFPRGAGIYGFGRAPWGLFRWGEPHSMRAPGFGYLPWGLFPWGLSSALITAKARVESCGAYKFGFACCDKFGNPHEGAPEEVSVTVHVAPAAPAGLKKYSYNKTTGVLVLDAA